MREIRTSGSEGGGIEANRCFLPLYLLRQNLLFAVAYNIVAVPLAILGFASPLTAALAMSGSSILVMINALRAGLPERRRSQC
jgi:hypothetical protein